MSLATLALPHGNIDRYTNPPEDIAAGYVERLEPLPARSDVGTDAAQHAPRLPLWPGETSFLRWKLRGGPDTPLRLALRLQPDWQTREGTFRHAVLAVTYARRGDPEQACHVGSKAVDTLARDVDSDRCVGHVRHVRQALTPYQRLATVKQFGERVEDLFEASA